MFTKKDFLADAKKIDAMPKTRLVYVVGYPHKICSWGVFPRTQNDFKELEKSFPREHYLEVNDDLQTITETVRNNNLAMEHGRIEAEAKLRVADDHTAMIAGFSMMAGLIYPPIRVEYIFSILIPDDKRLTAKKHKNVYNGVYMSEFVPASHTLTVKHVFDCDFKFVHCIDKPHFQLGFEQSFLPYAKVWEAKSGTAVEKTMAVLNHYTNYFKFFSRNHFEIANNLIKQNQKTSLCSADTFFRNVNGIFRKDHSFIKEFGYQREYYQGDFGIMLSFLCCALDHARQNEFFDMLCGIFITRPLSLLVFDYLNNFENYGEWWASNDLVYQSNFF